MDVTNDYDVVLIGLGPVGAALACLMGAYGLRVCVLEKSTDIFQAPRAIALDHEALRILQAAGLPEGSFSTISIQSVHMHSPYQGRYNRIDTAGGMDGHPKLVTFFQPELERVLRQRLAGYSNVDVRLGWELLSMEDGAQGVSAQVRAPHGQASTVQARYLVGADGATSTVRRLLGLDFQGETYAEDWLVVDVQNAPKPIDHIEFICNPERPVPHMPAPGNRQRWEFKLQPGETREQMERPEVIQKLLSPWDPQQQATIERVAVYRFHARVADSFRRGRVFLVGDAAHITPPFAGQGLVAGLRDAGNLAWKLAWVCQGRARVALLESYDTERRPHAKEIIDVAKLMGRMVMPRNKPLALFTHSLVRLLRMVPRLRRFIETSDIKPPHRFHAGAFVRGRAGRGLLRGGLFPQAWVRHDSAHGAVIQSDEALGCRLVLVGLGLDPTSALSAATRAVWEAAGGSMLTLLPRGQFALGAYEDMAGSLVGVALPLHHVVVVRPDRAVVHDGAAQDADAVVRQALSALAADSTTR